MIQYCIKSQNVTKSLSLAIVYFILHQMVFIKNQKKKSKIQKSKNQIDGNKIPGASFVLR